jgi:hypothetical protein
MTKVHGLNPEDFEAHQVRLISSHLVFGLRLAKLNYGIPYLVSTRNVHRFGTRARTGRKFRCSSFGTRTRLLMELPLQSNTVSHFLGRHAHRKHGTRARQKSGLTASALD